ncbi:unnamed protein product [Symbiodinium pilosum]|uniref:Uncharacterized protein n=1 Tax=Symbiodinium pilosum TaxID=2952 RepID=A0A812Q8T4_SYMPI|nr:unnamed protein product [Symbiodinium pilosum]
MESIPVALLVDFLHAALSSKRQDRAVHRTSCGAAIKALRWLAKHLQWQALQLCAQNNLVTSYSKQVEAYDKREAVPLPLSLVLAWEQCICRSDAPLTTKLVLGAILVCTRSSIRFGDAQRVRWGSLQLSTQGLHATAYATKTTKAGQPFFCAWHGLSGRDASTSWLLHWLAALASIPKAIFEVHADTVEPDYLFPHLDMHCISVEYLAPASYTRTLLCLRWAAQSSMLSGSASLTLTLRSMKSTALASAAQLRLSRDDRLSQGHHRDSARLYSRNDTFASLRIQRSIALAIADGWRPQRSMARGGSAPVPEPPFTAPRTHPAEHLSTSSLLEGPWRIFTSRHESIHATQELADSSPVSSPASTGPAVPPEDPAIELDKASDPEAEAVEEYALLHGSSESEAEATALHVDLDARTYVCSGPWGSMHVPTAESLQAYTLALPKLGSLAVCKLRAACGAHLGPASFVAVCKEPVSLCRSPAFRDVPETLQTALQQTGLASISDFAYAYTSSEDLSTFIAKQSQSLWDDLQVTDPERCPAVACLRRALDLSKAVTRAKVAALTETMKNLQLKHGNKTLCLRFNRVECNDKNCKFAYLCAVRLPNGQACGQRHPASQHRTKAPADKAEPPAPPAAHT